MGPGKAVSGLHTDPIYVACPYATSSGATSREPFEVVEASGQGSLRQCRSEEAYLVCTCGAVHWRCQVHGDACVHTTCMDPPLMHVHLYMYIVSLILFMF